MIARSLQNGNSKPPGPVAWWRPSSAAGMKIHWDGAVPTPSPLLRKLGGGAKVRWWAEIGHLSTSHKISLSLTTAQVSRGYRWGYRAWRAGRSTNKIRQMGGNSIPTQGSH